MAEGNPVKSFYVQLPGYQQGEVWDEEKYNRNKEQLFKDHQDAMVVETSPLAQDEVIKDDGMFTVKLPGYEKGELWDGAKLNRNREQLLKDHPDAVITKASPVNYWGDKLTDISTKIDALENELKGMPNEERHLGMNISDADALDVITDTPERRRRNQINTELDQLYRERESNPAWQTYWDKQKEELRGSIQKAKEDADISKGVSVKNEKGKYDIRQYGSSVESDYFKTAQQLYKDALKTAEAPSKYDDSLGIVNFARGAAENIGSAVTMLELAKAMKMTNVIGTVKQIQEAEGENVNLIDLIQNHPDRLSYLSPGQKEVMNAFIKRAEIEQGRSGDMSIGYQAGAGAIQSLGFMGDFLLTGGAGSAAGKAVAKKVAKATTEELAEKSLAGITKKMLVGNLEGATKSLVMTPLMPSSYSNFINSLAQLDSNGGMDLSGKAVLNSIGDTLIETFSENAGELFGIPFEGKLFDSISKSKLGEIGKAMGRTGAGRLLKDAGWHGMVGEMAEEVLGNAMRTVTGIDENALKNFFSKDELLTTLASFAPMSIIGAGASMHQVRKAGKSMAKDGEKLQNILRSFELDEDQIKNLLDVSGYETPEQLGSAIAKIGKTAADAGKITQENVQEFGTALGNYVMSASKYKVLQGVFEDEQDAVRAQNTALIDEEVGDSSWYHQGEEGNYVRALKDNESGKTWYVISSDENDVAVVGDDGTKQFIHRPSLDLLIQDGRWSDTGEQPINDYLDSVAESDQRAAEQQRMAEETSSQITAIQERIAADPTINMGTEEAPKMAVVDAANANGVHVTWQDEDGAKDATLTWEQVGNYLGTPVEVKTDEQIEQEEIQAEEDIRSRKEDYNKTIPEGTEFTAVLVEGEEPVTYQFKRAFLNEDGTMMLQVTDKETGKDEQITEEMALQGNLTSVLDSLKTPEEIQAEEVQTEEEAPVEEDNTLRDFRGNPIPLKDDGSVNQTALWNADPEAWARWNDSQRNDGGANSRGYIAKATKKLQSDAKAVQKQIDKELDFDRISELEGQLGQINSRIADLERIENNYANAEVAQTEAEKKAEVEQERQAQARERTLNEPQTLEEVVSNWLAGVKRGSLNKEDFKKETGLGETELKRFFPWWAKKGQGMSVMDVAEAIAADDDSGLIPRDSNADQPDIQSVRNAIINVMTTAVKPSEVKNATKEANLQREAEMEAAYSEAPVEGQVEDDMPAEIFTDKQGNPLNDDGTLAVTPIASIDELTDEDFTNPARTVALPALPANVDAAIGASGKTVIIKKNIFERNARKHTDLTPDQSRQIINDALYNPQLYGQNQKASKPFNWVVINTIGSNGENRIVLLEIDSTKYNVEIVHWHYIDERGIEKIKRQAEREDGQLLILPSVATEEVGALSDPTLGESSDNKDNEISEETSISEENIGQEIAQAEKTPNHPARLREAYESGNANEITEAQNAIRELINGSEDIDRINTTAEQAKARRKKAEKGSAEYKTNDFIAKAASARLKQLRDAGMRTFAERRDAAMEVYFNLDEASESQLRDALAYFESQSQYEADRGRAEEVRRVLDERSRESAQLTDAQKNAIAFVEGKTPEQVAAEYEAERQMPLKERVREWEERTGVTMEVLESRDQVTNKSAQQAIDEGQNPTGWFEPNTGKVVIYLPNVKDVSEIDKTYMHEVVSHKGLRELLGEERFGELMDTVWNDLMSEEDRSKWLAYNSHLSGNEEYLRRAAADEFVAHVAENLDADTQNSVWDRIIEKVKEILNKIGLDIRLTDEDLKSLLRSSLANYEKIQAERKAEAEKQKAEQSETTPSVAEEKPKRTATKRVQADKKIDDFGQKIGGARKDQARERIKDSTKLTVKDLSELKDPDKILSRKQIAKYVAEGQMTSADAQTLLATNMAVRSSSGFESYKSLLLVKYRDMASAWERGEDIGFEFTQEDEDFIFSQYSERIQQMPTIRESIRKSLAYHAQCFEDYRRTYEALDYPNTARDIKSAYIAAGRIDGKYWVKGSYSASRGYPFATFDEAVNKMKSLYPEVVNVEKAAKKAKESGDSKTGHLKVVKDEYGYYRVKSNLIPGQIFLSKRFYNKKDAEAYLNDNAEALVEKENKMAYSLMGSNIGMVQREGQDYRKGKDITEKDFMETFNPKGVEFGNWVPQAERQEYLNKTYDAIMDFCQVVGISPKAVFLGGRLGIAFGSRGKGGALAHYESMKEVINLTRMKGAGSLAHEWFHALDNYLAKRKTGNVSDMATDTRNVERQEVADAFTDFVRAMNALDYTRRSKRAGEYWGEVWERAARLFADYTYNELGGKGIVSPLLARMPDEIDETQEDFILSVWPYATKQENATMKPYFDRLFAAIQEEEGTGVLFRKDGDVKQHQLDIINESNPMTDDYHTGIRSVDDIKTWDEAVAQARQEAEQGGWTELASYPDITNEMVNEAQESGRITVYSSYPIENGVFVTPSRMQAKDYAGEGEVYSKTIPVTNVAWINTDEGQYAETDRERDDAAEDTRFRKANQTQNGFISNAEMALDKIKMEKATPEQWRKMLEKEGGLKAGEDKWLGLSDWLKDSDKKTLTKDEIGDFIEQNRIQIEEQHYSEEAILGAEKAASEALQGYQDEFDSFADEWRNGDVENSYYWASAPEYAFEQMVEKYGDDFRLAFEVDGHTLAPMQEYDDEFNDATKYFLGLDGAEVRPIDSVRLDYTTPGLSNKAEIALTVPTIDPWNEGDKIHFGDAGEGRAVAWIRFGDATSVEAGEQGEEQPNEKELTPEQRERLDSLEKRVREAGLSAQASTNQEELDSAEAALREAIAERDAYNEELGLNERPVRTAPQGRRSRVLVIDEIQSKRHQEGRERGYADATNIEALEQKMKEASQASVAYIETLKEKYDDLGWIDEMTEEEERRVRELDAARITTAEAFDKAKHGIPAAPFEKNWHELAMKRMLRLAAEEGYDKIAWTTGDQQAERYNLGGVVNKIESTPYKSEGYNVDIVLNKGDVLLFNTDKEGTILSDNSREDQYVGKNLSDVVGKDIAKRILDSTEEQTISGDGLRVGGEGMNGFYDDILPRFMNKYGKKWGVKVGTVALEYVYDETGHPLVMHSVDVTPEMKESVMEGQTMFRKSQITPEQDREYMDAVNAGDMDKAQQMVREAAALAMPDTKVVDEDGKPAIVYHGSSWNPLEEKVGEGVFKDSFRGTSSGDNGFFGRGFYFTYGNGILSRAEAGYYGPTITEAFLNIENPFLFNETLYEYNGARNIGDEKNSVEAINMAKNFPELCEGIFLTTVNGKGEVDGEIALEDYAALFEDVYRNKEFIVNETEDSNIIEVLADPVTHRYTNPLGKEIEWTDYAFRLQMYRPGKNEDAQLAFAHFYLTDMTDLRREDAREMVIELPSNLFSGIFESEEFTDTLKARGYDGVLQSAKGDEAVAFNANQIKSAEPVTYDGNGNIVPLSERFNEESDDIRFSLRGIIGAENAEDEAALDNLEVAEEMENAGKDSQTIWKATGWERGADGKWRNEIPDAKQKEGVSLQKHNIASEVLDAPELFASYPQLAEIPIDLANTVAAGAYSAEKNRIVLDTDYNTKESDGQRQLTKEGIRTILHELQHAIQHIEGFAKGTNAKQGERLYYRDALKSKPEETYFAWFFSRKNSARKLNQVGRSKVIRFAENYDQSNLTEQDKEYFRNLINYLKGISDDEFKKFVSRAAKVVKTAEKAGEKSYENSAGEVEARNAERRSRMSEEDRRRFSPEITEEVSRNEQEVRFRRSQELVRQSREGGLAGVIGDEDAAELYRNVYRVIPKEIRERIVDRAGDGFLFSEATQNAIAEAVEKGDETGIAGLAANMLRDYVGDLDERTARYILWRGDRKVEDDDLLDTVNDIAMQRRLQVGEFADPVRFRLADDIEEAENRAESMADDAKQTKDENKAAAREDNALTTIKAMSLQKEYDKKTVNTITVLAKNIIKDQNIDTLNRREIARLLGIVTTSVGKAPKTVKKNADALVGLIVDHLMRSEETKLGMLANRKATKTNQAGVEVQGELDVRGQNILRAYKAGLDMDIENPDDEFDGNTIKGRLSTLSERLSSTDDAVRSEAEDEYAGLMLAQEYQENIKASINEERGLKNEMKEAAEAYRDGNISRTGYNQFVEEAEKSLRENKIDRIEAYRNLRAKMLDMMAGSVEARKEFTEREKQRVEEIHHLANSDMQGKSASPFQESTRMGRLANSSIVRFFAKPLATFDQMLRLFGEKNVAGEGYLFNKFHRGWIDAQENAYLGEKQAKEELDAKVSEVFDKKMRWSDLYAEERKMPTVKVKWWDGGEMKEHDLTQGNLLYIYMVNKMTDGRMKLRRMGITEETVDAIKRQMDSRFIELADWLQEDYLVNKRNKYNAVHERLFGASMAAIEDYFPLKINKRSLNRAEDIGRPEFDDALPATTTGSIIKRRRNAQDLDLLGADAFSVVIEHVEQMEQWAAFAEFNKDINTLLSYKRFRNQVQNMATVYGSGGELWRNFEAVCRVVGGTYNPAGKKSGLDRDAVSLSKGLTAAKISFRIYTALKQLLSMPAFLSDANIKYLGENIATPWKAWNWAMENLPLFEKRWKSRQAGDTRLMQNESDWKIFQSQLYDYLSRIGMSPNAFVDALTVSIGSHAIYQTRYDRYIKDGYTEAQADKKAKQDATTLYNETQQSSEAAFVSPVQLDRTWIATALTVFRNSSMGYQRQFHDAIRNIGKMMKPGYKASSIEFMKKQMIREGLTEEQAQAAAERNYNREIWRSFARIGTFGFLVQFAWNLGPYLAYLLVGGDDDKKEEMLKDAAIHAMAGGVEGLAGGNIISEMYNKVRNGESLNSYDPSLMPIISDIKNTYKKMNSNPVAGWYDLVCIGMQGISGVNPQTFSDAIVAVVDACDGDLDTSKEAMLLFLRVIQTPQSQLDQLYIDELGINGTKASGMSMSEMAERYARYKMNKEAGPLVGLHSEESAKKREKTYQKRFKTLVKERKDINKPKDKK